MSAITTLLVIFLVVMVAGIVCSALRPSSSEDEPQQPVSYDPPPVYQEPRQPRERCHYINKRNHRNDEKMARHKANQYPW